MRPGKHTNSEIGRMWWRFLIVLLPLLSAVPADAATVNTVQFGTGGLGASICAPVGPGTKITSGAPIFQEFSTSSGSGHCQQNSVVRAGSGSVGVSASMQADGDPGGGNPRVSVFARSEFDLVLGVPEDWVGGLIPIQLTAFLEADLSATILTSTIYTRGASAQLQAAVELGGFSTVGGPLRTETGNVEDYRVDATSPSGTPFDNLIVVEEIATGIINIDPRQAIRVAFELNGNVNGYIVNDAAMTGSLLALNSLGFALAKPIFELPDGFTLDAPEFGIVNNRYVGTSPAVVPVPAAGALFLGGLAMLVLFGRRRFRRNIVSASARLGQFPL